MKAPQDRVAAGAPRAADGPARRPYWVVYDGRCSFCRATLRLLMAMDWFRRLRPMDLHATAEEVARRAPRLTREQMLEALRLITPRDQMHSGFFAFRRAARLLPLMWPVLPLLYLPGMSRLGPWAYRWIARRRYGLVRCTKEGACKR